MAEINNKSSLLINGQQQQQQSQLLSQHQISDNFILKDSSCQWNNIQTFQNIDTESLLRLESLINEFFLPITGNERKRQIEQSLAEFSNTSNSWQISFIYFERTSNEYTKMYCLTVIESFINQRWHTLSNDIRQSFRTSLWKHLFENHANITPAIRNKFCKILVTIARYDWPYQYPDFMSNILELLTPDPGQNILHSATLILLGLNLLGTAVEELSSNKSYHNHFAGTIELVRILQSQLPNMLQALTLLLESIISKHVNYYSATPPPSPTSIHNQNSNSSSSSSRSNAGSPPNILSHIIKSNDTLGNVFQMSLKKGLLHSIPEMDQEFVHLTSQIFVCLSQIIDFMPVSYFQSINSTLLSALYVLATFGSINSSYNSSKLGLISMNCINELISKVSTFDSEANEFIYNVFHNTFLILQLIVSSSLKSPNDGETRFDEIDEDYLKKFIDFLKLFIGNHLGRFEKFISFPTKDFLQLLFEFTTKMCHSYECYLMLLDTWSVYFDYLENYINQIAASKQHKDKRNVRDEKFESIKEPILSFLLFILRSIQYSCNQDYLKHLDDQTPEDDCRTELENYIYQSIEIVAKIADIYPEETINYIDNYYNEKLQNLYYGLEFLVNNNNNNKPTPSSMMINGDGKSYHCSSPTNDHHNHVPTEQLKLRLEDFIITLQVISRFANYFIDIQFEKYFLRIKMKFDKLCEILHFIEMHKFDNDMYGQTTATNPFLSEFLMLKAQIIATFKAYIVWYQQVCCASDKHSIQIAQAIDHITIIINTCCSIICDNNNCTHLSTIDHHHSITANVDCQSPRISKCLDSKKKMFHSAALTLNTFSANVRPSFVFNLQSVQRLFDQNFQSNLLKLNVTDKGKYESILPSLVDKILISQSISNFLILPWFQLSNEQQNWERRSICLNMFIGNFLHLFNDLDLSDSNRIIATAMQDENIEATKKCPNVYCRSLYILKQVIKSHSDSPLKSKQMLLISLNSSLEAFIQLLTHNQLLNSTIVGCQITEHILSLFIVVFKVLFARIHMDFVERTIQSLLQIINRHNFMVPISRDTSLSNSNNNNSEAWPGLRVIIKFLKLLILVIGQQSLNSFIRTILPDIIDFAVIRIQTTMINVKSPMTIYFKNSTGFHYDIYHKMLKVYYGFLYELLLNNCRYFFPQRLNSIQQQCVVPTTSSSPIKTQNGHHHNHVIDSQQQRHFDSIMEIIGESFLQPENIHLFRQNVDALESMNQKLKLYERLNFREKFRERYLFLFMQTLLDHSLDLLQESLFTIIYHLAQVDFPQFYESFMPKYISNLSLLNDQQRLELMTDFKMEHHHHHHQQIQIDFPTFSSKLNQLLCNVRFFYKCNI
ncbi:Exportin-6 [Dermatophagoides farinae]|uniref:Exportin-6 n=1 Tax=Dermatophagoides farinae TaxID=6954 RepID=A0A922ICL5_DERFA|nr:Exportin-6 [Dermatophagoides farinae]